MAIQVYALLGARHHDTEPSVGASSCLPSCRTGRTLSRDGSYNVRLDNELLSFVLGLIQTNHMCHSEVFERLQLVVGTVASLDMASGIYWSHS